MRHEAGFTLIEVLIALVIISVAFSALMNAMVITVQQTHLLKERTLKQWVAKQGMTMIQLGLLDVTSQTNHAFKTHMFNQDWYWRVKMQATPIPFVERATITVSTRRGGPYTDPFYTFRYHVAPR